MNAKEALKVYFGYDSYKPGQEELIESVLSGRDAVGIMPTGAGKSICYQVPALVLPGITIVISPLISLMQDQVKALNEAGIHAGYINSSLTENQILKVYDYTRLRLFKILYVAPERLESPDFLAFARDIDISMVTVDEAHCISQWGQDFRPSYLKILDFVRSLPKRPVIGAFTATATEEVRSDIICMLQLTDPKVVVTGFDRENLYFSVETPEKKDAFVLDFVQKHPKDSGIIYCATRKNVDALYELLYTKGIPAARYHAGMGNAERKRAQDDFIYDALPVIVATNAFGMGIDKSNVRYVIHYNMPQSMENYYQEAGRAGRDGEPASCVLLFSVQDIIIDRFLLEHKDFSDVSAEDAEAIRMRDSRRLRIMEDYCRTTGCLRNFILGYFGERRDEPCDSCGNCHREFEEIDMTSEAKQVVNCVYETRGRYGMNIVIGTLMGANRARLRELNTVSYRSYGKLEGRSEDEIRQLINQMILDGYIYQTEGKYSVLRMGNIEPLKKEDAHVIIRMHKEKEPERSRKPKNRLSDALTKHGYDLFDRLKSLRLEIAKEEGVPPYIVFNDRTLVDMCIKQPADRDGMLAVSGVGEAKYGKYGERFIEEIAAFRAENPNAVISIMEPSDDSEDGENEGEGKRKKAKKQKEDFYLNEGDAEAFVYKDFYLVSEIKAELDRISTAEDTKKASTAKIGEFLLEKGYTEQREEDGKMKKYPTEAGWLMGIETVERTSFRGDQYTLILYPEAVQREIVEHFIRLEGTSN